MIEPQQVQDAKRALGAKLALRRRSRGLTQADLAARVYSTRSTVAGVERGHQVADRVFWQRCERLLDTDGQLLATYDEYQSLRLQFDQERRRARQHARWGETDDDLPQSPGGVGAATGQTASSDPTEKAWSTDLPAAPMPGQRLASVTVDPALALHWNEMLQLLAVSHNAFGSRQVYGVVCRELPIVRHYRHVAPDDLKPRLLAVEARWAEFASWTADSLGDVGAATHWLDHALTLANRAGDKRMAAYIFMRQAQQAVDRSEGTSATGLARTAETIVPLTDRDRALCLIRQAQGHALRGDRPRSLTAITAARELVDRATGDVADDADTIGRHCTDAYLRAHEGYCLLRLGQARAAVDVLEDVLNGWPVDYRQDEALTRGWLALSYVATNRLAEAGAEGSRALTLAAATASARAMRSLRQVHLRLAGTTTSADVTEFRNAFSLVESTVKL
ncbi:helix-turn-helix transcriptional regulator [Micromonospora craniellae]|uniref:helix-turn-helix transcriptional regulator n=1 Tax=Micromonospora craniellae TaxID=2294034 RepID=UPI0013142C35|nr:helix-turn-helix transcriptional regulator [Micromonospora craniellae]QOC89677.1 helix-turn-helix domain-containing protein [Micromonospora craniellae]